MKRSHAFLPLQNSRSPGSSGKAENELHIFSGAVVKPKGSGEGERCNLGGKKNKIEGCRRKISKTDAPAAALIKKLCTGASDGC